MKISPNPFSRWARLLTVLCAGILWSFSAAAQPEGDMVNSRFLLIFDTSSAMKPRVPATQYAVERLFLSMMNRQLHVQDDIGVWAFDRELRAGELPLQRWVPQEAAMIATHITNFVRLQHYSKSTRFDAIIPAVNNLVKNSQRLTVLIFCDGAGQIKGTPYDEAINSLLKQNADTLEAAKAAFIIVLRAQSGQYTGYSVNSSAVGVDFPEFPPLPAPPQTAAPQQINTPVLPAPVPAPAPRPVATLPPLVIVGTNVSTNPLPPIPVKATSPYPPPARVDSSPSPTKPLPGSTHAVPAKMAGGSTNAVPAGDSGLSRQSAMATGVILLAVATLVIILGLIRSRRPRGDSLITRSMNKG
jgi:hypothetical protein